MNEISAFLKEYVFRHTSKKLDELVLEVSELDDLERTGYPCRECGQKFKYHSTRVKYVVHRTIKFLACLEMLDCYLTPQKFILITTHRYNLLH